MKTDALMQGSVAQRTNAPAKQLRAATIGRMRTRMLPLWRLDRKTGWGGAGGLVVAREVTLGGKAFSGWSSEKLQKKQRAGGEGVAGSRG